MTGPAATPTRAAEQDGDPLRIMTFNLRFASDTPPNSWPERRPATRGLPRRERPHVIGTQEGRYGQPRDIHADLGPHHDRIGTGRAGGSRDEFMAVLFGTRRPEPVEFDHFWLSDTPDVTGSIRRVTWVRFRDLRLGRELYFLNTHLDSASPYARARAAELIVTRIGTLDRALPLIVTGDFNMAAHRDPVYDTLLGAGLVDSRDAAAERGKLYATFHGYEPLGPFWRISAASRRPARTLAAPATSPSTPSTRASARHAETTHRTPLRLPRRSATRARAPDGDRIDWILTSPGVTTHAAVINTFALDGGFPSDHLRVRATLSPA